MIVLNYPNSGHRFYFEDHGYCLGPFDLDGNYSMSSIIIDDDIGDFQETRGIFGENNVVHTKIEGTPEYSDALLALEPNPSETALESLTGTAYWGKTPRVVTFRNGLASSFKSSVLQNYYYGSDNIKMYDYVERDGNVTDIYQMQVRRSALGWYVQSWWRHSYDFATIITISGNKYFTYRYRSWYYSPTNTLPDLSWSNLPHGVIIRDYCKDHGYVPIARSPKSLQIRAYTYQTTDISPSVIRTALLAACNKAVRNMKFVMPGSDVYGNLAMVAVRKVNPISTNMLEFLNDIRHPTELFQQIRNLQKLENLKDLASNYLSVDYGVLPTIDDLKTIIEAFDAAKPYFDKNGFSTYSAYEESYGYSDSTEWSATTRIKIAIADEDSRLVEVFNQMDQIGVFPRFESLWDLVPYSFVIDWFLGIGDLLRCIDTQIQIARLPIRYATMSYRRLTDVNIGAIGLPLTGKLSVVHYHRWVSDQCPVPPAHLQLSSAFLNHTIEGGALLVSGHK